MAMSSFYSTFNFVVLAEFIKFFLIQIDFNQHPLGPENLLK